MSQTYQGILQLGIWWKWHTILVKVNLSEIHVYDHQSLHHHPLASFQACCSHGFYGRCSPLDTTLDLLWSCIGWHSWSANSYLKFFCPCWSNVNNAGWVKVYKYAGIDQLEELKLVTWLIWSVKLQHREKFNAGILFRNRSWSLFRIPQYELQNFKSLADFHEIQIKLNNPAKFSRFVRLFLGRGVQPLQGDERGRKLTRDEIHGVTFTATGSLLSDKAKKMGLSEA